MEDVEAQTAAPIWRRDGTRQQSATCNPRHRTRSTPAMLLPITPIPSVTPGGLVVPSEQSRVVYLAPLTSTSAEKSIARSKKRGAVKKPSELDDGSASDSEGEDDGRHADAYQSMQPRSLSPVNYTLSKLLVKHMKRADARKGKLHVQSSRSSASLPFVAQQQHTTSPKRSSNDTDRPHDDQLERLKLQIHSLPITDDEKQAFWATLKSYQRLKLEYRAAVLNSHTPPIGFNMEAWNKKLLEERHQLWVHAHEERIDKTKLKKAEEDEKYERRILESTTEYRAQLRVLRDVHMRLLLDAQLILPVVMLAGATQIWLCKLQAHWRHKQVQTKLHYIVRNWCKNRATRSDHTTAAHVLINWLHKSVAVKTVAFKVFRGIRNYVRYVKRVQQLWKVKQAKRLRNYLLIENMWIEHETNLIDRANEDHERKAAKADHTTMKKKRTKKTNSTNSNGMKSNEKWLTYLPVSVREAAIKAFLRDTERKFIQEFRQQEEDLYPHLVQTLRGENPNRARSYVKAMANSYALLGRVYTTLRQYPGAVDDVCPILPFDMHNAPIFDLIIRARDGISNDQVASAYLQTLADEEKRKQFQIFLERRQQYRAKVARHPADATGEDSAPIIGSPKSHANHSAHALPAISLDGHPESPLLRESCDPCSNEIPRDLKKGFDLNAKRNSSNKQTSALSFGLVAVCSSFKYLPSLSDKTKELANGLFNALVDSHFARFSRRGTKLLINPSVIEFQDTMKELRDICAEKSDKSAFFLCLVSHGARVESGVNEGSYVLFNETRLSSEDELLLTAIHEKDLAKSIHDIPCKNKLIALEVCQLQQAREKPSGEAPTIRNRVSDDFSTRLYNELLKTALDQERQRQPSASEVQVRTSSGFNTVLLDSCNAANETPVRCREHNVSNFLHRLSDAFHGAAIPDYLTFENKSDDREVLMAQEICTYVRRMVQQDAKELNEIVKEDYQKQLRTKYEQVAEFHEITHTPQLIVLEGMSDFVIGDVPAAPELQPQCPDVECSTLSSVTLSWQDDVVGFRPSMSTEVPTILGYHVEIKGAGRACESWRRAAALQVMSFEEAVRKRDSPPRRVTVHGLASDTAYQFRIRACTAGGWGPFSEPTAAIRTKSAASVHDTFSTVRATFESTGPQGLRDLMGKHEANRDIQRVCIEFHVRLASNRHGSSSTRNKGDRCLVVELDAPLVSLVLEAIGRFPRDGELARQGCLFLGHLSLSSDSWRKEIASITKPYRVLDLLTRISDRFRGVDRAAFESAKWAIERVRGVSQSARLSSGAAACRIQGLYRMRKARQLARSLAQDIYHHMVDPYSGRTYVYNSKTGSTSWELPSFLA